MAFTRVQGATGGTLTAATSITATFGAPVTSGNCVAGAVAYDPSGGGSIVSIADDKGNTYIISDLIVDASNINLAMIIRGNITNAPTVVTVTFNIATGATAFVLDEYSGALTVNDPRDGHTGQLIVTPGAGTSAITSGNFTTTLAGDLIYCAIVDNFGNIVPNPGTGFTLQSTVKPVSSVGVGSEALTQSAAGSIAGTWTENGFDDRFDVAVMAIKSVTSTTILLMPKMKVFM